MAGIEVRQYRTAGGRVPFGECLDRLRDATARARITARIDRRDIEVAHVYWQDYCERKSIGTVPRR